MLQQVADVSLPRCYAAVDPFLKGFRPPTGAFDPNGTWDHRYAVCVIVPKQGVGQSSRKGWLRIQRRPADDETVRLDVDLASHQNDNTVYRATWRIVCAADQLTTPRRWELEAKILDQQRNPVADTEIAETGEVANGAILRRGARESTVPEPASWTSNWSLFDAVQRLPGNDARPLAFDMLEELELLKPDQRLAYRETVEIDFGAGPVRLDCFEQIGVGILPYQYWLDDQRRLLMVIGGLRAFIFDPTAGVPEVRR